VVRDQTEESTVFINIPAIPETDVELNEQELEKVAGGCHTGDSGLSNPFPFPFTPTLPGFEEIN
jgi:hypothetical protein